MLIAEPSKGTFMASGVCLRLALNDVHQPEKEGCWGRASQLSCLAVQAHRSAAPASDAPQVRRSHEFGYSHLLGIRWFTVAVARPS